MLKVYDESIVIADIPGLIEGASEGAGLGHDFLRHIERVRLLVHIVDISGSEGRDPYDDFVKINRELDGYSAKLAGLTQIICVNKTDLLTAEELDKAVKSFEKKVGKKVIEISAYTHQGIDTLIKAIIDGLKTAEKPEDIYVDEDFEFENPTTRPLKSKKKTTILFGLRRAYRHPAKKRYYVGRRQFPIFSENPAKPRRNRRTA